MKKELFFRLPMALIAAFMVSCSSTPGTGEQELFVQYTTKMISFDKSVIDLYDGGAIIELVMDSSPPRTVRLILPQFRNFLKAMPYAEQPIDPKIKYWSEPTYRKVGTKVLIKFKRLDESGKMIGKEALLVGPGPDGKWLIYASQSSRKT